MIFVFYFYSDCSSALMCSALMRRAAILGGPRAAKYLCTGIKFTMGLLFFVFGGFDMENFVVIVSDDIKKRTITYVRCLTYVVSNIKQREITQNCGLFRKFIAI